MAVHTPWQCHRMVLLCGRLEEGTAVSEKIGHFSPIYDVRLHVYIIGFFSRDI